VGKIDAKVKMIDETFDTSGLIAIRREKVAT